MHAAIFSKLARSANFSYLAIGYLKLGSRTGLQPKRRPTPKNPVLTTTPNPSLKGRRPLTYAFRRAVDRFYVKKGLTTRFTYFFRNSDSRYT